MSIGIILVTHGQAGAAMLEAAQQVVGSFEPRGRMIRAIGVEIADTALLLKDRIDHVVDDLGVDEVLFLVDLSGSTPFNLCCRSCGGKSVVLSGLNMPMLFKLSTSDPSLSARELADVLAQTGAKSISVRDPGSGGPT